MAEPDALRRDPSNLQDGSRRSDLCPLAESEADPELAEVFHRLPSVEGAHCDF